MNHWQATAAISSKTARVFDGTLDSAQTLTVWEAAGQEDVLATNPEDPTMGPGVQELTREALRMMLLKPFTHKKNSVEIVGDTAVIYFEEFAEDLNRTNSFYTKLPTKEDLDRSTFALVYHAFEKIKNDGNVKNVVFDVTNNGGGDCVVGYYVDATGRVGGISGFLQLGAITDGEFVPNEDAVVPDLPMTDEEVNQIFFHPDKIAEFIASHTK